MEIILPEIVAIGIYNSRIAAKNKAVTRSRKTTMFELELPLEEGGVSHINDEKMPIAPNVLICAKPGQSRHTQTPYKCYYIHMILKEGALFDHLMDLPHYVVLKDQGPYEKIFQRLCKCFESSLEADEIRLHSMVLDLVSLLLQEAEKRPYRDRIKSNHDEIITEVIHYIKDHLTDDLSLEALAEYAGFSPVHFHHCFKASTGQTLRAYVEEQRIKKAANLLISTDQTLAEIAYECGFSSQSYFSYAFKRKMKNTPREYAREVLKRYSN